MKLKPIFDTILKLSIVVFTVRGRVRWILITFTRTENSRETRRAYNQPYCF